jgi:tetratricopeptide (TPR) repeat protein
MTNATAPSPQQLLQVARQCTASGRLREAEAAYRRLVARDPDFHPAYHGLGLLAFQVDRLDLAAELLASAITLAPQVAVYHRDRGEICRRLGRRDEAVREGREAARLAPDDPECHYNLGLALVDREDFAAAAASYRRAIALDPRHGRAFNNLGSALERLGDRAAAADAYRAAVAINDRHMEAQNNLGSALSWMGDIEGARACFEKALAIDPRSIVAHYNLSTLKRYREDDAAVAVLESLAPTADRLPLQERTQLLFTLGKMRDDIGRYDAAFAAYAEGNRLKASTLAFNEMGAERQVADIVALFNPALLRRWAGAGNADPTPIFIVGMPRSGTSLTEQILASHSRVHGAGELRDLHRIVAEVAEAGPGAPLSRLVANASSGALTAVGDRYLDCVRALAPAAARITDKMPGNFHYLGLIRLALPNAKVVHVVRDPMDSCLSCYTHLFNDTMEFAYDLGTLGRYYVRYMKLMAHWRAVLPPEFLLEVRYEELVADVEGQTRRMLDHVGLPWEDACLSFHENARPVRTASLAQVRRPIYKTSVAGWKRFERQLAPLLEIVKDYR